MRVIWLLFFVVLIAKCLGDGAIDGRMIKPLADDYKVLYKTEDPQNVYVYDPSVAVCPNGRIIGCFSLGGRGASEVELVRDKGRGFIYISDDNGQTWRHQANFPMSHARAFVAGNKLYILGHRGRLYESALAVVASDDWGDSWTEAVDVTDGVGWHGSATNVWYKDKFVYMVMERRAGGEMTAGWRVAELAPVLLRGDTTKDLTKRENWTLSSKMKYADVVDDKEIDWFGAPFYAGFYPNPVERLRGGMSFRPMGWLEGNVIQITDPKHYWYDPKGNTFHIFLRAHTGLTNLACVIKAVEQPDGTIETMFQKAPSGKTHLYVPLPGGQLKFSVVYDEQTSLYWLASNQSTDSMTKPHLLPKDRVALADNERRRLVLHFSKNMIDWCFAGVISIGPVESASRHYCQMVIKDGDLLIMSRSGDLEAKSAHDGNIATFHKVENFRDLVY